jgi:two-component system cell cycle sensor histidine kinase/response regulator CckA
VNGDAAIRTQLRRLQTLFMDSPVGMAFAALDGTVLDVNWALCEMLGRSRDEVIGSAADAIVHPSERSQATANQQALKTGSADHLRMERRFLRPDGTVRWGDVSVLLVRNDDGEPDYTQVAVVDVTDRKLADEAHDRLAAIVQSSSDAIIGADIDGVITSWNPSAERMYGYTAEEMVGGDGRKLLPPWDTEFGGGMLPRVMAGERIEQHHLQRVRKDGTLISVSIISSPVRDSNGTIYGVATAVRDLSDEERAQRHAAMIALSSDAIIATALDGRVMSWNRGAEALYGWSAAEMVDRDFYAILPPDRRAEAMELRAAAARGEALHEHRSARLTKDARVVHVSVSASPITDADGVVIGVSTIARDITATVEAEEARRAAEARMQAVLENAPIRLGAFDAAGVLVYHQAGRSMRGSGLEARQVGEWMGDMIPDQPETLDLMRRALAGEEVATEMEIGDRVLAVRYTPLRDELGKPDGMIGVAVDITDRVRAEREREAIERRLRRSERLESLGQLAGGVAHDFNNLLAVILNYAQFIAGDVRDEGVRRDVEEIRKAAERAARLTKQLLIFGRQDSADAEILDLDAVVADTHSLLTRTLGEHIELVVRTGADTPPIRADRGRIEQVLVNLAVNARDAMPDGGTLTIETGAIAVGEDGDAPDAELQPGVYARLLVSDTGTGMSEEVIAHAFEPFFTTKPQGVGTGLGLATVYGIVSSAGGQVGIYSEGGLGTTVRVHLPAAVGTAVALQRPSDAILEGGGETILVVEDDDAVRAVTARMLRRHGYVVLQAASGEEAFALAETAGCRLLLTDVLMPHMSGREVAERIRALRPELPVVFMSGYSQGVLNPQRELGAGVTLLQKPFDEPTLLACIHAALHNGGGEPSGS